MGGIGDAGEVARMLYQNMLETTSGADERDALFASRTNTRLDQIGTLERTAMTDHQAVARGGDEIVGDRIGVHGLDVDR